MGQDTYQFEGYTQVLEERNLQSLVKYMKSEECKNVVVMLGAGVSTSAGIPDFRSPETGLYANLARLKLPYPEAVFEINFFRNNPRPFYTLARELMPGKFRPTLTHSFVRLLAAHNLLSKCFTQNIDTLERRAGVPPELIIEAHGSFASQHCIKCKSSYDGDVLRRHILDGKVAICKQKKCGGLVKPDIVFFGEQLPHEFHTSLPRLRDADLLIVMGTSLTVHPFASLASMVSDICPRVLINLDLVGNFGSRSDDVVLLGKTDDVVRDLARELGWEEELDALWKETESSVVDHLAPKKQPEVPVSVKAADIPGQPLVIQGERLKPNGDKEPTPSEEETLKSEVDKLASEIEKALNVSEALGTQEESKSEKATADESGATPAEKEDEVKL
ncbi:NAD-dependent deacetylase sirtuin-2 [Cristinia sonorae]|uniref:NAD-dependent protein deacetylase n=1 Tax=Cristinia sonorae TaxID=1940300 RepID=A0A8K0XTE0_9AGAR|nr:NAD-dependent deacetylase sirtuin-2 [Cristinia sonorae]